MVIVKKKQDKKKQKEWENPIAPSFSSDERDKEQLMRQYTEAKRRKDNLTEEDQTDTK